MWMLVSNSEGNDFLILLRSNDVDFGVLYNKTELNNEYIFRMWILELKKECT